MSSVHDIFERIQWNVEQLMAYRISLRKRIYTDEKLSQKGDDEKRRSCT